MVPKYAEPAVLFDDVIFGGLFFGNFPYVPKMLLLLYFDDVITFGDFVWIFRLVPKMLGLQFYLMM